VYFSKKKYDLAIESLNNAIHIQPNNATALNNRCWAKAVIDQLPEALSDCKPGAKHQAK
jgi:hypothetical protein